MWTRCSIHILMRTMSWVSTICGRSALRTPTKSLCMPTMPRPRVIERIFDYTFDPDAFYPTRARVEMHRLGQSVEIEGAVFHRVPLTHGEIEVAGFRFGNAAYLTDMSDIPESSFALLKNLDVVILDALRKTPHPSHATLEQALAFVHRIQPRRAFFTHMSHDLLHAETNHELPEHIQLAYDGLRVPFEI